MLIVLGLVTAGVGVALGTIWRADDTATATLPQEPEVPVVVAGGNVLATVNSDVTITVTGQDPDTDLVLAMGRESDVQAWLDDADYLEVTGLQDWDTLAVQQESTEPSEEPSEQAGEDSSEEPSEQASEQGDGEDSEQAAEQKVPNPAGSDLWIEQVTGKGELTYDWNQVDGRWMMLVASDGSHPAPTVSMTWNRNVATPLVLPLIIAGAVVFLIGLVWLIVELLVLREERRAKAAVASGTDDLPEVPTTDADGNPLTRRQIREAARAAAANRSLGAATGSGAEDQDSTAEGDENTEDAEAQNRADAAEQADAGEDDEHDVEAGEEQDSGAEDLAAWVSATAGPARDDSHTEQWQGTEESGEDSEESAEESGEDSEAPEAAEEADEDPDASAGPGQDADTREENDTEETDADESRARTEAAGAAAGGLRGRWRRRRRRNKTKPSAEAAGEAPVTEQLPLGTPEGSTGPATPSHDAPSQGTQASDTDAGDSDSNPQASGASWRATWGLRPTTEPDEDQEEDR